VTRVVLPHHLRNLAGVHEPVTLDPGAAATQRLLVDALEARYPALRVTIRDPATMRRRPFVRFFAGGVDLSHCDPDLPLPAEVVAGVEPFYVVGAMAGG
jgi:molybdopterin synthase sulfur carrier subunit